MKMSDEIMEKYKEIESLLGEYISLHNHPESEDDGDMDAKEICVRAKEIGMSAFGITDHGVVSAWEDYRRVFKKEGLKGVFGCELYVVTAYDAESLYGRRHLIVLAKDDMGRIGVGKIVTESNLHIESGFPVISINDLYRIIKKYKGHIIGTSACMQGVIAVLYRNYSFVERKIEKITAKQEKYLSPESPKYEDAKKAFVAAEEELAKITLERDETKRLADQKFSAREKAIKKLTEQEKEEAEAELLLDKNAKEAATKALPGINGKLTAAKKAYSSAKANFTAVEKLTEKYRSYEAEKEAVKKYLMPDEEIEAAAEQNAKSLVKIFGEGNFFMEVQYHGIPDEAVCYPKEVSLAKKLGIPLVATNDVHFLRNTADDRLKRQILRSLRFGNDFEEEGVGDAELYLKDRKEVALALLEILQPEDAVEAINNTKVIADMCNVEWNYGQHYPKATVIGDVNEAFDKAIFDGIEALYGTLDIDHMERLAKEIPVIKSMGYVDYHMIVKEYVEYGKLLGFLRSEQEIQDAPLFIPELKEYIKSKGYENGGYTVGTGRGSAVGSVAVQLLGITNLDPLKYNLKFERFLNQERVSMPDIDCDFSNGIREKCIEHVKALYGADSICGILTKTKQAPKGAINIAAKFYGLKTKKEPLTTLGRAIAKEVPEVPSTSISFNTKVAGNGVPDEDGKRTLIDWLRDKFSDNSDALEIIRWAAIIENSFTGYGVHPAGIVITDGKPVSDYLPLKWNENLQMMTTQCDMVQVEDAGLLKFDFLGLTTLDIIDECLKSIEDNYGKIINPLEIPLDDKNVYEKVFQKGLTGAVFQFSSKPMRSLLRRFKPESFEDLIILNSMYRPGPLQYLDDVIDVKNGKKPLTYLCPELEPILGKTYGAIVYQEQVMEIFQSLAGYTLGGADTVRRYMSKKKVKELEKEREAFINGDVERGIKGCVANGIKAEVAVELFEQMTDFASYAFNKSHAAAYSHNAYITAWLKTYYPVEFFSAALNWAKNTDEAADLIREAKKSGVKILAPDINKSGKNFKVSDNAILYGLSKVKGVKSNADTLIKEREKNGAFKSLKDFYVRVPSANKVIYENLTAGGAFDSFSDNRTALSALGLELSALSSKREKKEALIKASEAVLPVIEKGTPEEIIAAQEEAKVKVEYVEPMAVKAVEKRLASAKTAMAEIDSEIKYTALPFIEESKTQRLNKERAVLGAYISENPLDSFPSLSEVKVAPIKDITGRTKSVYGIISDLTIKKRKSDGADMAFFTIEDETGTVEAACFAAKYKEIGKNIKEGAVAIFSGKTSIEKDDEGEDCYKFFVEGITPVKEKKQRIALEVESLEAYNSVRKTFLDQYRDEKGVVLLIYDKKADKFYSERELVSLSVLSLKSARKV